MSTGVSPAFPWAQTLAVAAGAIVGALARWRLGVAWNAVWGGFPLGTLAVNLIGGFLIGLSLAWFDSHPNELLRLLLVTGGLGGLTTFSAYSAESLTLLERGTYALALGHTAAHVLGALACAAAGLALGRLLFG